MELGAQSEVHQDWNHHFKAVVEVKELVAEDGSEDLQDQVMQLHISCDRLCPHSDKRLALRLDKLYQMGQQID